MTTLLRLAALGAVAALVLAACGDDRERPSTADATATPPVVADTPAPPVTPAPQESPTETEPATPPDPPDAAAVAAAVAGARPDACGGEPAALPEGAPDHELHLLAGGPVVAIVCDVFAYQRAFELRGWNGSMLTPLEVEQWQDGGIATSPLVLGEPVVVDGRLTDLERARGLGDCGRYQEWSLRDGRLVLDLATERVCSDESAERYAEPTDWERVHPAA